MWLGQSALYADAGSLLNTVAVSQPCSHLHARTDADTRANTAGHPRQPSRNPISRHRQRGAGQPDDPLRLRTTTGLPGSRFRGDRDRHRTHQGIATPEDSLDGLENKAWIFGHSRWLGAPGLFLGLQNLDIGDSGESIINAENPDDIPAEPVVTLQTSVREAGAGKQWILEQQAMLAKATNTVEGDLDDPCKYLLLFITASPAP